MACLDLSKVSVFLMYSEYSVNLPGPIPWPPTALGQFDCVFGHWHHSEPASAVPVTFPVHATSFPSSPLPLLSDLWQEEKSSFNFWADGLCFNPTVTFVLDWILNIKSKHHSRLNLCLASTNVHLAWPASWQGGHNKGWLWIVGLISLLSALSCRLVSDLFSLHPVLQIDVWSLQSLPCLADWCLTKWLQSQPLRPSPQHPSQSPSTLHDKPHCHLKRTYQWQVPSSWQWKQVLLATWQWWRMKPSVWETMCQTPPLPGQ